jgi:hypothetical protein
MTDEITQESPGNIDIAIGIDQSGSVQLTITISKITPANAHALAYALTKTATLAREPLPVGGSDESEEAHPVAASSGP